MRLLTKYLLSSCALATLASPALAQTAAKADEPAADGSLQEIIVTANKLESPIQRTPIAIRAYDGEALAKQGVTDVASLARLAPDLGITTDTYLTKLAIRGIASLDVSETGDAALTINIDGEYINRPTGLNASFFDLERIEVLRGPQGTLYGRNATAGAINIIAAKPKLGEFGGFVTAGYGNYDAKTAQAAVNLPVGDTLAVRIAGMHSDHGGYFNNTIGKGGNANVDAVRAGLLWEPTDRLTAYVAGEYVNIDQLATPQFGVAVNAASGGVVDPNPATAVVEGGGVPANTTFVVDRANYPLAALGYFRSSQYAVRGRIAYDTDFAAITYTAGYRNAKINNVQPLNGFVPELFTFNNPKLDNETQSHELRFNGGDKGSLQWQAGAFYFKERQDIARGLFLPLAAGGSYLSYFYRPDVNVESYAAFGQLTVPLIADTLSATGGLRYTHDSKSATYINFGPRFGLGSTPPTITTAGSTRLALSNKSEKLTWNFGLDWTPTSSNLVYAKVSTGYKGGGFDNIGAYGSELLTAYEVGSKNRFNDNKLELNAAAFYYDYSDQQVQVFVDTSVGARTLNAGSSRIWGVEADFKAAISPRNRVTVSVNYLNAEFREFPAFLPGLTSSITDIDAVTAGVQAPNLKGNTPPQAPRWTIALGYDYTVPVGDGKVTASVYSKFKSKYYLTAFNFAADEQKAYTQTDLTLEYTAPDSRFSVQAYVRNLENTRLLNYAAFNGGGINIYNFIFGSPRTYGAQATVKF